MSHQITLLNSAARLMGPVIVIALGWTALASAQVASSPFATKKKTQAWEQAAPTSSAPAPTAAPTRSYGAPTYAPPSGGTAYPPSASPSAAMPAATTVGGTYSYTPPAAPTSFPSAAPIQAAPSQAAPSQNAPSSRPYYPGRSNPTPSVNPYESAPAYGQAPTAQYPSAQYPDAQYNGPQTQLAPQSWTQRLGLDRITHIFSGKARLGAAATNTQGSAGARRDDDWGVDYFADAELEYEASAVTQGGLEYGINLEARAQVDRYRRGFGGRVPDCPPTIVGCSSALVDGVPTGLRGHTSGFYQFGDDTAKDTQFALESAHLFLRSAYGDVTVGRDDGAAFLFSLGAPTLLGVGASNSPVDYTGLDSVKTVNDASGFAEKVTYTTPRLLGDTVGFGIQLGASYAPDARACGVDYCVKGPSEVAGILRPDLEDVLELGLALDRTFSNGLKVEGTATYARASEVSGLAGLDDLTSWNVGAELGWDDWTVGGSYLQSNNGLLNGDYTAYDMGVTFKPSDLGVTLNYGHAEDDNIGLVSDQATLGLTYDIGQYTFGTGLQWVDRETTGNTSFGLEPVNENATSIFVEGAVKF